MSVDNVCLKVVMVTNQSSLDYVVLFEIIREVARKMRIFEAVVWLHGGAGWPVVGQWWVVG